MKFVSIAVASNETCSKCHGEQPRGAQIEVKELKNGIQHNAGFCNKLDAL